MPISSTAQFSSGVAETAWYGRRWVQVTGAVVVLLAIVGSLSNNESPPTSDQDSALPTDRSESSVAASDNTVAAPGSDFSERSWESEIARIAGSAKSKTEKHDEAYRLGRSYSMDRAASNDRLSYLISEYRSGNYLNGLTDDKYALTNILTATVLERSNPDTKMADFAFDFYQNTKYVYRGVDAIDSDSVLANEDQMDRSIAEGSLG